MKNKLQYFDELYHHNDDPWDYQNRWYEERKRNICLALLLKPHYQNVLEVGCSNGIFSAQLAQRSKKLLCVDANRKAIELAKAKLHHLNHVEVRQNIVPDQFPQDLFDLIVVGEILYYLNHDELSKLIEKIHSSLTSDGMILCCHWRYPIENFPLNGDLVHTLFRENLDLHHYLSLNDPDFIVDVWTKQTQTLAGKEGLI